MRAAQDQVPLTADLVGELHTLPTQAFELFDALPSWVQAVAVMMVVTTSCLPRLLRALDDHLLNRTARRKITRSEDWVEVIRIRNEPRRLWSRRPTSRATCGAAGEATDTPAGEAGREQEQEEQQAEPP